jgi:hypothetical protein
MISLFLLPPHPYAPSTSEGPGVRGGAEGPQLVPQMTHPPEGDSCGTTAGVRFEQQIGSHRICNTNSGP